MCYSNCPYENYHGECTGRKGIDAHCFEGFVCEECGNAFEEHEESNVENVCLECYEELPDCEKFESYCFEIYTLNPETKETGWEIKFVEVLANSMREAREKIKSFPLFDCVITSGQWPAKSVKMSTWK